MGFSLWVRIAVLLVAGSAAAYGCYVLMTGRLSNRSRAAFRSTRDAGMYFLCFGAGIVLLTLTQFVSGANTALSFVLVVVIGLTALALMGLAVIRYRARSSNSRR